MTSTGIDIRSPSPGYRLLCTAISSFVQQRLCIGVCVGNKELFIDWWPRIITLLGSWGQLDTRWCHVFPWHLAEHMPQTVESSSPLVIRFNGEPGCLGDIGSHEHLILGP